MNVRRSLCAIVLFVSCASAHAVKPGDIAPSFAETPLWNGGSLRPGHFVGKVIYLDFWATWCAPCRESFPELQALEKKFGTEGLAVIAVNVDESRADIERFLQWSKTDFLVLRDEGGALAARYALKTMPMSFLIDREGKVAYTHLGFRRSDVPILEEKISALLKHKR